MTEPTFLESEWAGDVLIVRLLEAKLFGHVAAGAFRRSLVELVDLQAPGKVLVDFSRIESCPTEVIGALLTINKHLTESDGQLILGGMRPSVRDVFRVLNIDGTVFEIYESFDEALAAF